MGNVRAVSPPPSRVPKFFTSLAGMITIGLVAGLLLCTPFFVYWQQASPETTTVSSVANSHPPTPPTQAPVKTGSNQRTNAVDQFFSPPEQSTTAHSDDPASELAQASALSEKD